MGFTELPQGLQISRVDGTKKRIHPLMSLETATYEIASMETDPTRHLLTAVALILSFASMVRCIDTEIEKTEKPLHTWSIIGVFIPGSGYTDIWYLAIPDSPGNWISWPHNSVPRRRVIMGASFCLCGPGNVQVLRQILKVPFAGSSRTVKDRLLNWLDS